MPYKWTSHGGSTHFKTSCFKRVVSHTAEKIAHNTVKTDKSAMCSQDGIAHSQTFSNMFLKWIGHLQSL